MKIQCPYCQSSHVVKNGFFKRKKAPRGIRRYLCQSCKKSFSSATGTEEYRQRKRHINKDLSKLLARGMCLSDCARTLEVNLKTVEKRIIYLASKAKQANQKLLRDVKVKTITFDDVISKENSKCKPLTIPLAVCDDSRLLLNYDVGTIPAFGHLSRVALKKYGPRKDEHYFVLSRMFEFLSSTYKSCSIFKSDKHKRYPVVLKKFFPSAVHLTFEGGRGCIAGQGELKKKKFDPMFSLNHTAAMLRAKVSRLMRKSWNTTKSIEKLFMHLAIYQYHHNFEILSQQLTGGV